MKKTNPASWYQKLWSLILERGPMTSPDIIAATGINPSSLSVQMRILISDGILISRTVQTPGSDKKKMVNLYSMADPANLTDDKIVLQTKAKNGDAPKVQEGEFNPADPFKLGGKIQRFAIPDVPVFHVPPKPETPRIFRGYGGGGSGGTTGQGGTGGSAGGAGVKGGVGAAHIEHLHLGGNSIITVGVGLPSAAGAEGEEYVDGMQVTLDQSTSNTGDSDEIPPFLIKPAVELIRPEPEKVATILDNDPPESPTFDIGYRSTGEMYFRRNGVTFASLTKPEADAVRRFLRSML